MGTSHKNKMVDKGKVRKKEKNRRSWVGTRRNEFMFDWLDWMILEVFSKCGDFTIGDSTFLLNWW